MSRVLHLTSPHMTGSDVKHLQQAIDAHGGSVNVDGDYGPDTQHAEIACARTLGVLDAMTHRQRAQAVILDPSVRTRAETDRAKRVHEADAKREKHGPQGALALARKLAAQHIVEHPANSNTGGLIDVMQAEVGIHAAPWCGAAYRYIVKHGGGLALTPETRYCPSIEAHARAGTGGYKLWLPVGQWSQAHMGDAVVFNFGGPVDEHVEFLVEATATGVHDFGGNTSSGDAGSQSNGGGFYERRRSLSGISGFARPRWT